MTENEKEQIGIIEMHFFPKVATEQRHNQAQDLANRLSVGVAYYEYDFWYTTETLHSDPRQIVVYPELEVA